MRQGDTLLTRDGGLPILRSLAPGVAIRPDTSCEAGGMVLGVSIRSPPASLIDAPVAEVNSLHHQNAAMPPGTVYSTQERLPQSSQMACFLHRLQLVCTRFLALARAKLYWMIPKWGGPYSPHTSPPAADLPVETQFLLLELEGGREFALVLPLIDGCCFRASLRPPPPGQDPPGAFVVRLESGDEAVKTNSFQTALYILAGKDPFDITERGVAAAARISGIGRPRRAKQEPAFLDVFGWCTWDAFYTDVSPGGIQKGLATLGAGGTPVRFLVIDDGWQQTELDEEFRRWALDSPRKRMRTWSAGSLRSRRVTLETLFQDLQITEPLRVLEKEKEQEEAARQGGSDAPVERWGAWRWFSYYVREGVWLVASKIEAAVMSWMKRTLEGSPSDSKSIEVFIAMATGPLKKSLLRFYAAASSHSRRLLSVKANGKFENVDQGPDATLAVERNRPFSKLLIL